MTSLRGEDAAEYVAIALRRSGTLINPNGGKTMKATLEFNLYGEEDESDEFKRANQGRDYYCALCDIQQFIRAQLKYGITMTDEQLLEAIRDLLPEDME